MNQFNKFAVFPPVVGNRLVVESFSKAVGVVTSLFFVIAYCFNRSGRFEEMVFGIVGIEIPKSSLMHGVITG